MSKNNSFFQILVSLVKESRQPRAHNITLGMKKALKINKIVILKEYKVVK